MVSWPRELLIEFIPMLFCQSSQNGSFPKLICWNGIPGKLIGTILRRSGVQGWIPLNALFLPRTNVRALPLAPSRGHFLVSSTSASTYCATPAACIWPVARGRGASLARGRGPSLATGGAFRSSHQLVTSNGSNKQWLRQKAKLEPNAYQFALENMQYPRTLKCFLFLFLFRNIINGRGGDVSA